MKIHVLLAGAFVLCLAAVGTARADDWSHHVRADVRERLAQDGRGGTADFHARFLTVERPVFAAPAARTPQVFTSSRQALPLKASVQVRMGHEGVQKVKLPASARQTTQAASADQKPASLPQNKVRLPIKSDILVQLGERRNDATPQLPRDHRQSSAQKSSGQKTAVQPSGNKPTAAELARLPLTAAARQRLPGADQ